MLQNAHVRIAFFIALLLGVGALAFFIFLPYFTILIVAGTLAVIFEPLHRKIAHGVGIPSLASLITVFIIICIFLMPLILFGTLVFQEAANVYTSLATGETARTFAHDAAATLESKLRILNPSVTVDVNQMMRQALGWLLGNTGMVFSSIAQFIFSIFIGLLALYYLLKDGHKLTAVVRMFSPLPESDDELIFLKIKNTIRSVVVGTLIVALVQGLLVSIGFYTFGVPNGALWGAVAAVAALIPFLGTAIILLPGIAYLFITGSSMAGLGLVIWGATAVGLVDNLLTPKLMERGIKVHPLLILLSVLGGLSLFGPAGFLIGPLVLSLLAALFAIYKKDFLAQGV
ncbi:MAG: AI-2E family transporter [Patescibacteria group bacterium]